MFKDAIAVVNPANGVEGIIDLSGLRKWSKIQQPKF
jgi:hypothetical protein